MKRKITLGTKLLSMAAVPLFLLPNLSFAQKNVEKSLPKLDGKQKTELPSNYHITPKGDTIVSFSPKGWERYQNFLKHMPVEKGIRDLPDDPQHPMYGLNLYVPAYDTNYITDLDWYASGDVDGNNIINMADHNSTITGTDPFNDGTYRGDTDMDGVSGTYDDKAIILDYINGDIDHINIWELESETEKTSHLNKALEIDDTDFIPPSSGYGVPTSFTRLIPSII